MNKIITTIASAVNLGAAMSVTAAPPRVPAPYITPSADSTFSPGLSLNEKVVYALIICFMQAAEGVVYQQDCTGAAGAKSLKAAGDRSLTLELKVQDGQVTVG